MVEPRAAESATTQIKRLRSRLSYLDIHILLAALSKIQRHRETVTRCEVSVEAYQHEVVVARLQDDRLFRFDYDLILPAHPHDTILHGTPVDFDYARYIRARSHEAVRQLSCVTHFEIDGRCGRRACRRICS